MNVTRSFDRSGTPAKRKLTTSRSFFGSPPRNGVVSAKGSGRESKIPLDLDLDLTLDPTGPTPSRPTGQYDDPQIIGLLESRGKLTIFRSASDRIY